MEQELLKNNFERHGFKMCIRDRGRFDRGIGARYGLSGAGADREQV